MTSGNKENSINEDFQPNWICLNVIKPILQQASKLLKCPVDKLKIFNPPNIKHLYNKKTTDRAISVDGIVPGLAVVMDKGLHSHSYVRQGITLFEARTDPKIRYVFACFRDHLGFDASYLVAKDGDIFRLYRYFKLCQKRNNLREAPILKDGLIEELLKQRYRKIRSSRQKRSFASRSAWQWQNNGLSMDSKAL